MEGSYIILSDWSVSFVSFLYGSCCYCFYKRIEVRFTIKISREERKFIFLVREETYQS